MSSFIPTCRLQMKWYRPAGSVEAKLTVNAGCGGGPAPMSPECTTSVFALTVVPPAGPSNAKIGPGGRLNVIV